MSSNRFAKGHDRSRGYAATTALVAATLKARSKCSFTASKLRFFAAFRLVLTTLATFLSNLGRGLRAPKVPASVLAALLSGIGVQALATQPWGYKIGTEKRAQQANFCATSDAVEELSTIFAKFGPRTGYTALSELPECTIALETFTPVRIAKRVTVSEGTPDEYVLSFVEVRTHTGERRYLVTSRGVER